MALSRKQPLTDSPTEIVSGLSLADGVYTIQNVGDNPIWFHEAEGAVATPADLPTDDTIGVHILYPGVFGELVTPTFFYAWSTLDEGTLSVTEAE